MKKFAALLLLFWAHFSTIYAQVGVGTNTPDPSAVLEIVANANNKGILIPRLTQAQRNAIVSPANGLLIYQTDNNPGLYAYDGSNWSAFGEVRSVNGQTPNLSTGDVILPSNTDSQTLSLVGQVLSISAGNSVTLANTNTDSQTINGSLVANILSLWNQGTTSSATVDLSPLANTDSQTLSLTGQVLTISAGNSVTLANTNTDSQTINGSLVANTLNLWNQGTTSSATVDLSSLANTDSQTLSLAGQVLTISAGNSVTLANTNTDSQTLDDVTSEGNTTTNAITVGDLNTTGTTTIGDTSSDAVVFNAKVSTSILPINGTRTLGDASNYWQKIYIKDIQGDATENPPISFRIGSNYIAGVSTETLFVGDLTGTDYYTFPTGTASPTAGQVLTVSSTTTDLYFSTLATLPPSINDGASLRWNLSTLEWEPSTDFRIAPGSGFSPGTALWVNQSLIPSSTALNIGQSGNEFETTFTGEVKTDENVLSLTTNAQSVYLKRNSLNLVVQTDDIPIGSGNKSNVAFGIDALNSSSSGALNNSAFGSGALRDITNGSNNTAIGQSALRQLTTGKHNTAVGNSALQNITTVSKTTAIGYRAGNNIEGGENIAVGYSAMLAVASSSGTSNIAIGNLAMRSLNSGSNNIALGHNALEQVSTGTKNIAIGSDAMDTLTTGSGNITIGDGADVHTTNLTNAIAIGQNAEVEVSNSIQLGNTSTTLVQTSGTLSATAANIENTLTADIIVGSSKVSSTNISATNISIGTQLSFSSNASTVPPLQLTASSLNDGVGAFRIDGSEPDIYLNQVGADYHSTVTFANDNVQINAFGKNNNDDFYITVRHPSYNSGNWRDDTLIIDNASGNITLGYILRSTGGVVPNTDEGANLGSTSRRWKEIFCSNNVINTSDRRLKQNIIQLPYGLETVQALNPVQFEWKKNTGQTHLGFIAQDIQKVIPEIIVQGKDEQQLLMMRQASLIPVLTKAIQEQQELIDAQQQKIETLEKLVSRIELLEAQMKKLDL
ncbi:MAG: tail fiber domain-containing protein [Flavobacteriaceae bacterium]